VVEPKGVERASQKFPHMADRTSGLNAVESKGCNYLLKPFSREQLLEAVRRSMKTRTLKSSTLRCVYFSS